MLHQFQHQEMELQIHFPLYGLMVLIKISVHMIGALYRIRNTKQHIPILLSIEFLTQVEF